MHGLPHHANQDLSCDETLDHMCALANSGRAVSVRAGSLTSTGRLRFVKTLGPDTQVATDAGAHIFRLGDHSSLVIRPPEFQGAHLWTADGDDYFVLPLRLEIPITLQDNNH